MSLSPIYFPCNLQTGFEREMVQQDDPYQPQPKERIKVIFTSDIHILHMPYNTQCNDYVSDH